MRFEWVRQLVLKAENYFDSFVKILIIHTVLRIIFDLSTAILLID